MADKRKKFPLPAEAVGMLQLIYCQNEQTIHLMQRCAHDLAALRRATEGTDRHDGTAHEVRR